MGPVRRIGITPGPRPRKTTGESAPNDNHCRIAGSARYALPLGTTPAAGKARETKFSDMCRTPGPCAKINHPRARPTAIRGRAMPSTPQRFIDSRSIHDPVTHRR